MGPVDMVDAVRCMLRLSSTKDRAVERMAIPLKHVYCIRLRRTRPTYEGIGSVVYESLIWKANGSCSFAEAELQLR